tara:strand:- start:6227 stop:6385 length:159 start_codon:yes stop_codon:yes gene_type:complete
MTRVNIEVESELHKKAKLAAVLEGKTLIGFINEAIREKVKKNPLEKRSRKDG